MAEGAARAVASLLACLFMPAAFGGLQAVLSGTAFIWYSNRWLAHLTFFPVACVGALLPWQVGARSSTPPCGLQPCHNACVASLLCLPPFHLPAASAISAAGLAAQVGGWQLSSAATASHHGLAMACRGKTTAAGQALQSCLTTFWAVA